MRLSLRRRPRESTVDRRRLVIDTAVKLFHTRGYEAVSINDIASATGMVKASLYYYRLRPTGRCRCPVEMSA